MGWGFTTVATKKEEKIKENIAADVTEETNPCAGVKDFVFLKLSIATSTTIYEYITSRFLLQILTNPANPVSIWQFSQFFLWIIFLQHIIPFRSCLPLDIFLPSENIFTTDNYSFTSVADHFCLKNISAGHFLLSIFCSLSYSPRCISRLLFPTK